MALPSTCANDASLGPVVSGCRDNFDFTMRFQLVFLAIVPAILLIVLALIRIAWLSNRPRILQGYALQNYKLLLITALAALQSSILGVHDDPDRWAVAATATQLSAALCLLPLSFFEHAKTPRPSIIICCYLLVQILLDGPRVRTAWMIAEGHASRTSAHLLTAALSIKAAILFAEAHKKSRWLRWNVEEHSPEETSGIINLSVFLWLNRLFIRGYQTVLTVESLYPLDLAMHSEMLQEKLDNIMAVSPKDKKFGLSSALARAFALPFLVPIVPRLAVIGLTFSQPFFIRALLEFLQKDGASSSHGFGLIGASVLIFGGLALVQALYRYFNERFLCMLRGCLSAAIYKKTTTKRLGDTGGGAAALALTTTDTERVVTGFESLHDFWACILEIAIGSWLLYRKIGASFISPFVIIVLSILIIGSIGKLMNQKQSRWMDEIQRRVGATANVIANMKNIKLGGLSGPVALLIENMRAAELRVGNGFRWLFIITAVVSMMPTSLSPVFTLVFATGEADTTTMFTSLSFVILLTMPLMQGLRAVPKVIAAFTCVGRIQAFLESEDFIDFRSHELKDDTEQEKRPGQKMPSRVSIENGSFGWTADRMVLRNVNLTFPEAKLTVVCGPTASGKSTMCKALLGEVPFASGQVQITGPESSVGFCDSSPFLWDGTIKENIIGYTDFSQTRYHEILNACMLGPDLQAFARGDETRIGSNGMALSGGQKQRVALARALYLGTGFLILDDVVSALDNATADVLLSRVFGHEGLLRQQQTTVILCINSSRCVAYADHIVVLGSDGTVVEQGTRDDLIQSGGYVTSLCNSPKAFETARLVAGRSEAVTESIPTAPVATSVTPPAQIGASTALDERSRMTGDFRIYGYYLRSLSASAIAYSVIFAVLFAVTNNIGTIWIKYWSEDTFDQPNSFYAGIFSVFQSSNLVTIFAACTCVAILAPTQSGTALHKAALKAVVGAPLSLLTTADLGAITTLFSQDMTLIDGELPLAVLNVLIYPFDVVVKAAVIATSSPWLALGYPVIGGVLWIIQKFYLRTSRQLRLLDLETKGPLTTHFLETVRGLATIRAFAWAEHNIQHNHVLLTKSQRPAYLLAMIQNWLSLTLDMVVAAIALIVVSIATQTRSNAGFTGASLVTLMTLGQTVTRLIKFYTQLETSIGAVARIKAFSESTPLENSEDERVEPPELWPHAGIIELLNVSASYDPKTDEKTLLALDNISLSISSGTKVAICGRTGSGKSSLILLLMRLLDPVSQAESHIKIDNLSLYCIDRATLRRRILALPQDAVFLPSGSTIKANLDPENESTDADCEEVLRRVGLTQLVTLDEKGIHAILDSDRLSAGQKQLFSLGRVIIRRRVKDCHGLPTPSGGVLLLDEMSSNVDHQTEILMQELIRAEFGLYTILMIAHRLDLVEEYYDTVIVMDKGKVVEQGNPRDLLLDASSKFTGLHGGRKGSTALPAPGQS